MRPYTFVLCVSLACLLTLPRVQSNLSTEILEKAFFKISVNLTVHSEFSDLVDLSKYSNLSYTNAKAFFDEKVAHLRQCYTSSIDGKNDIDLFSNRLSHVVKQYFSLFDNYLEQDNTIPAKIRRVFKFLKSLKFLAKQIIKCMIDVSNGKKASVYGLTEVSALSPYEFEQQYLGSSAKLEAAVKEAVLAQANDGTSVNKRSRRYAVLSPFSPKHKIIQMHKNNRTIDNPMIDEFAKYDYPDYPRNLCTPYHMKELSQKKPEAFNWVDQGIIGEVRNQFDCGSCWAFNTLDMLESYNRMWKNITYQPHQPPHKDDIHLSTQEVLDCSNNGCDGGVPATVLKWAHEFGVSRYDKRIYRARWDGDDKCIQYDPFFKIPSYCGGITFDWDSFSPNYLETLLYKYGPMMIALKGRDLQHSKGYYNADLSGKISHAAMLVGWNREFWIIKNSWGATSGVDGYLYISKYIISGINELVYYVHSPKIPENKTTKTPFQSVLI